ncbi:MAG: hypothetical protein C4B55_03635 [Candidatus Methanophagaceae archaeon]|nr:MAG: hypothetical protein C4B55_03635 [Methanophagales archaeon]
MSIFVPCILAGNEIESVATPSSVASSGPDKGYSIVCQNTGLNETLIFFTFSAVTENLFSPAGKWTPANSQAYFPSETETGRENSKDELNQTASFGAAFPEIDASLPCKISEGPFNSVTSALVEEIKKEAERASKSRNAANRVDLLVFISLSIS